MPTSDSSIVSQKSPKMPTRQRRSELRYAIDEAKQEVENAERKYLTSCGWRYTCGAPGSYWLWERTLPDGRVALVTTHAALGIQEAIDDAE